jgi:hypothetical protein
MLKRVMLGCVVAVGLVAAACGDDGDDDGGGGDAGGGCGTDTYKSFIAPLFASNCLSCHSATPAGNETSLDTYAKVKAEKDHVIAHAVKNEAPSMPYLLDPLPKADRDRIEAWYGCGAPEGN